MPCGTWNISRVGFDSYKDFLGCFIAVLLEKSGPFFSTVSRVIFEAMLSFIVCMSWLLIILSTLVGCFSKSIYFP